MPLCDGDAHDSFWLRTLVVVHLCCLSALQALSGRLGQCDANIEEAISCTYSYS